MGGKQAHDLIVDLRIRQSVEKRQVLPGGHSGTNNMVHALLFGELVLGPRTQGLSGHDVSSRDYNLSHIRCKQNADAPTRFTRFH